MHASACKRESARARERESEREREREEREERVERERGGGARQSEQEREERDLPNEYLHKVYERAMEEGVGETCRKRICTLHTW
jgi:hypothetical protein